MSKLNFFVVFFIFKFSLNMGMEKNIENDKNIKSNILFFNKKNFEEKINFFGDIHTSPNLFSLLNKLNKNNLNETFLFVGDYLDKAKNRKNNNNAKNLTDLEIYQNIAMLSVIPFYQSFNLKMIKEGKKPKALFIKGDHELNSVLGMNRYGQKWIPKFFEFDQRLNDDDEVSLYVKINNLCQNLMPDKILLNSDNKLYSIQHGYGADVYEKDDKLNKLNNLIKNNSNIEYSDDINYEQELKKYNEENKNTTGLDVLSFVEELNDCLINENDPTGIYKKHLDRFKNKEDFDKFLSFYDNKDNLKDLKNNFELSIDKENNKVNELNKFYNDMNGDPISIWGIPSDRNYIDKISGKPFISSELVRQIDEENHGKVGKNITRVFGHTHEKNEQAIYLKNNFATVVKNKEEEDIYRFFNLVGIEINEDNLNKYSSFGKIKKFPGLKISSLSYLNSSLNKDDNIPGINLPAFSYKTVFGNETEKYEKNIMGLVLINNKFNSYGKFINNLKLDEVD